MWDPKLGGANNVGAYQTFVKGIGSDYTVLPGGGSYPAAGSVQNLLQSGQAFFVRTFGGPGTITFTENAKVSGSRLFTRPHGPQASDKKLLTNLYAVNADTTVLLDAVLSEFQSSYSNSIDILDVSKLNNTGETLGVSANGTILAVERRGEVRLVDAVSFDLQRLKLQEYELELVPSSLARAGREAFLEDKYLQTFTAVNLTTNSRIRFQVSATPGSYAADRFRLVFKQRRVPLTLNNLKTTPSSQEKTISVYPNPVKEKFTRISFHNQAAGKYKVELVNNRGQLISSYSILVNATYFERNLSIPTVPAGNYQLIITAPGGTSTCKQLIVDQSLN